MPISLRASLQFEVKPLELPVDAADIPLGLAMMALSYGCVGFEIESGELTAEELSRTHLFLGPDSTYRLGILPKSSDEHTVECDDEDWELRVRQHELRAIAVKAENEALWEKARPKWEANRSYMAVKFSSALQRLRVAFYIKDAPADADLQDAVGELGDSFNDFRTYEQSLLAIQQKLQDGQTYVDPPPSPSRKTPYSRILRGPHRDRVTPAGFACFHDHSADHDSPTPATEQWLRKHGRDGRLAFSGVPSGELIVGARSALGIGRRPQLIPASCFAKKVGFDMEADRIYPVSEGSEEYMAFVDELGSALTRQPEIDSSEFNAWSNVTVDAEQFRTLLRQQDSKTEPGTRTTSNQEKIMIQKLVDLIHSKGNPSLDEAAACIGRNKKGSVFKRVCIQACERTGYVFKQGRRPNGRA
ncbi:hypothetical protein RUR49_01960 [Pseudoxanthobacter sp. M-2]|uniref:hypothetical protein n=1 Tax=Pseudoxanthobacter sp. M-2 TaxID=3078754 RepID=UPI0038FC4BEB